jgi:hypothetical protein
MFLNTLFSDKSIISMHYRFFLSKYFKTTWIFPLSSVSRPALGAHPASCTMGTGGSFPGGKARPERDADHSPPSSAEVENK